MFVSGTVFRARAKPAWTAFVAKLDTRGHVVWFRSGLPVLMQSMTVDLHDNVYLAGGTDVGAPRVRHITRTRSNYNVVVVKVGRRGHVVWATSFGGSYMDSAASIAVDGKGDTYLTGNTSSTDFPLVHAIQAFAPPSATNSTHYSIAFIAKLNPRATRLLYCTYFGGSAGIAADGTGIAVDADNTAYVTGETGPPPTGQAVQTSPGPAFGSGIVVHLNARGDRVLYSTYLGGDEGVQPSAIVVDAAGHAYVTGFTPSSNFPIAHAIQSTNAVHADNAFITELSPNGKHSVYSTYLGGASDAEATAIAIDAKGAAYITGSVHELGFPLVRPTQAFWSGDALCQDENPVIGAPLCTDAFVAKVSAHGKRLDYGTYLGGRDADVGMAISVHGSHDIYVAGWTESASFPGIKSPSGLKDGVLRSILVKIRL
ncbi:MAG: hypothetical protein DLM70_09690 [Chloroflexi bacterium]|nr:MAG: hypothetical protein DLM70_09690 [Chloroflexota bacterium]